MRGGGEGKGAGLSLGVRLSNLKSAPLTILEQLAFNAPIILGVTVPSKMLF